MSKKIILITGASSGFGALTARALAELKGVGFEDLATATTENFFRLFTKVTRP